MFFGDADKFSESEAHIRMESWGGKEAGDDQLPDIQAGARWIILREDLWTGEGLRMQLWKVQAHEAPRSGV